MLRIDLLFLKQLQLMRDVESTLARKHPGKAYHKPFSVPTYADSGYVRDIESDFSQKKGQKHQ